MVLCRLPAGADQPSSEKAQAAQRQYLRAILLERRGEGAQALEAYDQALSLDPGSAYVARQAVELALELGDLGKAKPWARRALELEPRQAQSHLLMGKVAWAEGDLSSAQAYFEKALKLDPKSSDSIFSLGSLIAAKDPKKAKGLLETFLKQNPAQAPEAHFEIAKIELGVGRIPQAEEHLRTAISLDPDIDSIPMRYALAHAYEASKSTDSALAQYQAILKFEPQNVGLIDHVGQLYFLKGDWAQAKVRFEAAKALEPGDPLANHWLALEAERRGDYAQAISCVKASKALKDDSSLVLRLGYYLTQAGRLKEAVAELEQALARWPNNDQVAYFLALGLIDVKEESKAARMLGKVLELKPDFREARYQLGMLLERSGDVARAEQQFRILLESKPDDAFALNYLGYSLADRGLRLEEAEALVAQAARLEPQSGAYLDSLGWVHFKQGRLQQSLGELLQALEKLPQDENIWEHLGAVYSALGQKPSAWFTFKKAQLHGAARAGDRAEAIGKGFSPEELGGFYLDYLSRAQGGLSRLSALCAFEVRAGRKAFSYKGIITFSGGQDLSLDLLGPLYIPLFRIRAGRDSFSMDPLNLEGVRSEEVLDAASQTFDLMRDYLSGALFQERPARYHKGWRRREVETAGHVLVLDSAGARAVSVKPKEGRYELSLDEFDFVRGRLVPRRLTVRGQGLSMSLSWESANIEHESPMPR